MKLKTLSERAQDWAQRQPNHRLWLAWYPIKTNVYDPPLHEPTWVWLERVWAWRDTRLARSTWSGELKHYREWRYKRVVAQPTNKEDKE